MLCIIAFSDSRAMCAQEDRAVDADVEESQGPSPASGPAQPAGEKDAVPPAAASGADQEILKQADSAYRNAQFYDALNLYRAYAKTHPQNARVQGRITKLEQAIGQTPPAPAPAASPAPSAAPAAPAGPRPKQQSKESMPKQENKASTVAQTSPLEEKDGDEDVPADRVRPTATGKGGATTATENMPLDLAGLIELRKKQADKPEFNAGWVSRFGWTSTEPQKARENIIRAMDDAKAMNMNAVVFQVRGEAATLYPSKLEPWSRMIGGRDPGFDPLRLAIDEAHKRGLEFHAYFNTCACSDEKTTPSDPRHIWHKHCTDASNPNWLVYEHGQRAGFNEYWWFNANLPEVQTYIRTAALDLVTRYNVDGLHFDRTRFPGSTGSDDPWSKVRFEGGANPYNLDYLGWQRDNLTRMLTDIYGAVIAVNPKIKVSAAVWGIYDRTKLPPGRDKATGYSWTSTGLQEYNQDSIAWANKGCLDALIPMDYWDMGGNKPDYDECLAYFVNNITNGRHVYGGRHARFSGAEMLRQVAASTLVGAQGTCIWTLDRAVERGFKDFHRTNIFPKLVPVPEMPWKTKPETGIVLVQVKDSKGGPVMDAHVKAPERKDVWLSSADGFCAIIDAKPGSGLVLSAEKPGIGKGSSQPIQVEAGKAAKAEIVMK